MKHIVHELNNMEYLVSYPDDYDNARPCPVILHLHGAGTRGWNINEVPNHSFYQNLERAGKFPFCIIFPLCPEDTWYDAIAHLRYLVREMAHLPWIDSRRIYLTGNSMGGYAAWQLAMSMPEYFAAVAPVCGGGMYWNAGRLKDVPVWAFHGAKDKRSSPRNQKKWWTQSTAPAAMRASPSIPITATTPGPIPIPTPRCTNGSSPMKITV